MAGSRQQAAGRGQQAGGRLGLQPHSPSMQRTKSLAKDWKRGESLNHSINHSTVVSQLVGRRKCVQCDTERYQSNEPLFLGGEELLYWPELAFPLSSSFQLVSIIVVVSLRVGACLLWRDSGTLFPFERKGK